MASLTWPSAPCSDSDEPISPKLPGGLNDPWTDHSPSPPPLYGLETAVMISAPATEPAGSNTMIAGMRRRLARTWEPTGRARIRPKPVTDLVCRHSRLL